MTIQVLATHQGGEPFPGSASSTSSTDWYSHGVWAPWARDIEWLVNLEAPTGTPTAGAITATFEIYVPTYAFNASQEASAGVKWVPVSQATNPTLFVDGSEDWPTQLIGFGASSAALISRRIRTRYRHRLHLTSTLSGGTSPGCLLSVQSIAS